MPEGNVIKTMYKRYKMEVFFFSCFPYSFPVQTKSVESAELRVFLSEGFPFLMTNNRNPA